MPPTIRELVQIFRRQHVEIVTLAGAVDAALFRTDLGAAREALERLGAALTAHLALEDRELYPSLRRARATGLLEVTTNVGEIFERNMESVSKALLAFLDEHRDLSDATVAKMQRDWSLVSRMLADRIDSEEEVLYPLYETLS